MSDSFKNLSESNLCNFQYCMYDMYDYYLLVSYSFRQLEVPIRLEGCLYYNGMEGPLSINIKTKL